eukprot:2264927-Rhodomonas_salina.3
MAALRSSWPQLPGGGASCQARILLAIPPYPAGLEGAFGGCSGAFFTACVCRLGVVEAWEGCLVSGLLRERE